MTTKDKIARRKLNLLELASEMSNVSKACRIMGYSRQQFYEIRRNYQMGDSCTVTAQACSGTLDDRRRRDTRDRPMRMIHRLRHVAMAVAAVFVSVIALAALAPIATAAPLSLTLVHVNDWDQMAGIKGAGGAARIAAVVAEERARADAEGGLAVVTFGGDMISPSVLSGIDKGAHMIDLANAIGFDVAVIGNHEFDFGPDVLQQRLVESETVWLASNVSIAGRGFPGTAALRWWRGTATASASSASSRRRLPSFRIPALTWPSHPWRRRAPASPNS